MGGRSWRAAACSQSSRGRAQCRDAWNLANHWRIRPGDGNDDTRAFSQWAAAYRERPRRGRRRPPAGPDGAAPPRAEAAEAARCLRLRHPAAADERIPRRSRTEVLLAARADRPAMSRAHLVSVAKEELEAAAKWARARLEVGRPADGAHRRRGSRPRKPARRGVARLLARDAAGLQLPAATREGGRCLSTFRSAFPWTATRSSRGPVAPRARVARREFAFESQRIIRSPFIGGAESELGAAHTLDAAARKLGATVSLPKLIAAASRAAPARRLEKLFALREDGLLAKRPPNGRGTSPRCSRPPASPASARSTRTEFQTRAKWHEMLGELAKLERVSQKLSRSARRSRSCSASAPTRCSSPRAPDAPIQVLGVLESAGCAFDRLWVSGLTDEAWPLEARAQSLPAARAAEEGRHPRGERRGLARARPAHHRRLEAAAPEVVFSCLREGRGPRARAEPADRRRRLRRRSRRLPDYPRDAICRFQEIRNAAKIA